ncbi:efflux RND transporter periplasmic adaptor subunit [Arcticibacter tournemirensis]|uniref:Efflux RND transporter periplasmic adaptor subunit n=1 Tax=Arcticibacter tournemirensis TaxID=699437 RepID=A0A5M9GUI2_9SPHI|nr:efflux RND transporter periplasmic adaptor subunit [Arcticibacter tournemirensis]KAA8478256.1 efflux RND transporter periplasmic adaptor subunit [Arcticibacter tournemirensis]
MNSLTRIYLPFLLLGITLYSCGGKQAGDSAEQEAPVQKDTVAASVNKVSFTSEQYKLADIQTGQIEQRNLSSIIKLNGVIDVEPSSTASVSAPLGGYIRTAGLLPGEFVKKGQILARLENPEFISMQQEYLESIGKQEYLEQEYKRQQVLRQEDVNATKTFQQVSSDYKVIRAKIAGLEQQMLLAGLNSNAVKRSGQIVRTASLYAPISGYIKTSNVNIGKYAAPTDILFEIAGRDDLHLSLNAFERDMVKLRIGQNVKFSLASENNYDRTAKVFLIGQAAGENKQIPVHCHFSRQPGLVAGMYVKAWIETGTEKQSSVPTDAVVQLNGKDYVIVQTAQSDKGYEFTLEEVRKGVEQEGYTAISVSPGFDTATSRIVIKNAYAILSALKNAEEEE